MRPLARRRSCKRSKLLCGGGSRACRAGAERRRVGCSTVDDNYKRFTRAIITIIFCPLLAAFAQESTPTPTPQTAGGPVATTFEVIVTGWAETAPRLLEATYVRPKTQTLSAEVRRYGGFTVRVYFDGQLQDSRANPPDLLTLFPAEDHLSNSPPNAPPGSSP